jgi:hypothetical protein
LRRPRGTDTMPAMEVAEPAACLPITESKRLPCDACGTPMEPQHAHYRVSCLRDILPCCG